MEQNPTPQEKHDNPERWTLNLKSFDLGPRKVKPEELEKHIAERNEIVQAHAVLNRINEILKENNMQMYQYEGGDECYRSIISINGIDTEINNETGLFYLPEIPDKWDENTVVTKNLPFSFL